MAGARRLVYGRREGTGRRVHCVGSMFASAGRTGKVVFVRPNVANNRIAADREAGCCNSG